MLHFIYCYTECCYAECRYAECHYTECRYAECRYAECHYAECRYAECRGAPFVLIRIVKTLQLLSVIFDSKLDCLCIFILFCLRKYGEY